MKELLKLCEICKQTPCHSLCPNYIPKHTNCYCSSCGQEICDGEEYIENPDGEYMHFDCFRSIRSLLEWLGYEIKTMEGYYE